MTPKTSPQASLQNDIPAQFEFSRIGRTRVQGVFAEPDLSSDGGALFLRIRPASYIVAMAIMALALVAKEALIRRRRIRAWSSVGFTIVTGLIFLVYIVAVFRPLVGYHGGLGG